MDVRLRFESNPSAREDRAAAPDVSRLDRENKHDVKLQEQSLDPAELERHRPYLTRFAAQKVPDRAAVEDMVQETMLAALTARAEFSGRSSVRTWLTGILKHKVLDYFRDSSRNVSFGTAQEADQAAETEASPAPVGDPVEQRQDWPDPEKLIYEKMAMEGLERCIAKLPPVAADAFLMRELMGFNTEVIRNKLGLTSSNFWVVMHRARARLRACMEGNQLV